MSAASVSSLWRYPVKSMAGEQLDAVEATASGLMGDRSYALIDITNGKVGSAKSVKKFGELLKWQAQFVEEPKSDGILPSVRITSPDGTRFNSDEPAAASALTAAFGEQVSLRSSAPEGLMLELPAGTLSGKHTKTTEVPLAEAAPRGTLFDYACIHIVTTATLNFLQQAYAEGQFAIQRFRPNIVVDCSEKTGFVENAWVDRTLAIGPELVLRVSIPCPRCVMAVLPRVNLPHDPKILRAVAQLNMQNLGDIGNLPCVGVYADVVTPGRIRQGDSVRLAN